MKGLCLIIGKANCPDKNVQSVVKQAVEGGVTMVQHRGQSLTTAEFVSEALHLKQILSPYNVPLIIHDRLDVALAIGAEGVHLGQESMPFELAKKLMPIGSMIGLSVENWTQFEEAQLLDLEYITIKPILPSKSLTGTPWGISELQKAQDKSGHRLMAVGGINKNNVREILKMGIDEIAITSAICAAPNPQQASRELADLLDLG